MTQTYIQPLAIALMLGVTPLPIANVFADVQPNPFPQDCPADGAYVLAQGGGYQCGYENSQNDASIGSGKTHTWTQNTVAGYTEVYDCAVASSSAVWLSRAYIGSRDTGSSLTWTATNTATATRHWGAGVLWNTTDMYMGGTTVGAGGMSASQWHQTCNGTQGYIPANFLYATLTKVTSAPVSVVLGSVATVAINVTMPYLGPTALTTVTLFQQKDSSSGSAANPQSDWILGRATPVGGVATFQTQFGGQDATGATMSPVPGNVLIYAVYKGSDTNTQPIGWSGWLGSQTASQSVTLTAPASAAAAPALASTSVLAVPVNNAKQVNISLDMPDRNVPAHDNADNDKDDKSTGSSIGSPNGVSIHNSSYKGYGITTLKCPAGKHPVHVELMSRERDLDGYISHAISVKGEHSITLSPPTDAPIYLREKAQVQLVCRDSNAPIVNDQGLGYGTHGNDVMSTDIESNTFFGGLGDDTMSVNHAKSVAFGGPGKDSITVTVGDTAVSGGVGDDYIDATSAIDKVVLDGGPGIDQVIGNHGIALINVLDGKGGDKVTCNSVDNSVIADKGDILVGPCTVVKPSDYE